MMEIVYIVVEYLDGWMNGWMRYCIDGVLYIL